MASSEPFAFSPPEDWFETLVGQLPAIVYMTDFGEEGDWLYISPQVEQILGFTPQEWMDHPAPFSTLLHPDDAERVRAEEERRHSSRQAHSSEFRMFSRTGELVWIRDEAIVVTDEAGEPMFWQGVMYDITAQRRADEQVREAEGLYRTVIEQIPAIVYRCAPEDDQPWLYISPQVGSILGFSPAEWLRDHELWNRLIHPEDSEWVIEEDERTSANGEPFNVEYRLIGRDGKIVWVQDQAVLVRDEDGKPRFWHGVMLDITERKRAEEEAVYLAYHDSLTGLPNRAMFDEFLNLSLDRAKRHEMGVAVLFLDLDNFRLVNDSLGHEVGDELLCEIGVRLREASRETDLIARQGGDEFLVLLADLEHVGTGPVLDKGEHAVMIAESVVAKINEVLATPFEVGGTECYVTVSIGVSVFPFHAADGGALLKHAEASMYRSKRVGPGGYAVYSEDLADSLTHLSFTTQLRKAVEREEWVLHYQPIVDLASGTMAGVEALVRWRDPNGGLIPPGDFIPLAEEMGLIGAIGDWVLREMCWQARAWDSEGLSPELSFNLSPNQLWQPKLTERILATLGSAGLDPHRVVIEITESTAMTDPDRTQGILWDLHAAGLRLAIDDFGTGYSSLSRLKHLPVDILKIDRSFIRDIPGERAASSMVRGMIQLAHSLDMVSLAEGVETDAQRAFLAGSGCELAQGYHFSRPVPAEEISARFGNPSSVSATSGSTGREATA